MKTEDGTEISAIFENVLKVMGITPTAGQLRAKGDV